MNSPSSSKPIRVRYAPSPTGYLHVGGARTLLFNWLYARRFGGTLVLRIEDTDQARSTREHEKMILSDIARLGLNYDEGPDVGGSVGPYRQSERLSIYAQYAKTLLDENKAYYCFCSDVVLGQKREAAMKLGKTPHYDGTCARISREDALARIAKGEKAGLRFRALQKTVALNDHVRGHVEFKEGMVGDFLVTRTPGAHENEIAAGIGMPVYNFCCVLDDHLMGMTHIIRGEDHLSNTARQLMIYEAFGWTPPEFAHTAMVLGSDRQKLSKRNGDTSVFEYLDKGYLPETISNFLALLGWWPPQGFKPASGHPEVLSRQELTDSFSLDGLQKAPAVFDMQKLQWMNGQYIRALPVAEICKRAKPFFEKAGYSAAVSDAVWFERVITAIRAEVSLLSDLPTAARMFFDESPTLSDEAKVFLAAPEAKGIVSEFETALSAGAGELTEPEVRAIEQTVMKATGTKGKAFFMTIRSLITGNTHGPDLKQALPIVGRAGVLKRVQSVRQQVGL